MYVFFNILYNFETFLILRRTERDMVMNNLIFFWPCVINWLYINYQLDALIIIYS